MRVERVSPMDPKIRMLIDELSDLTGKLYPKENTFQDTPEELVRSRAEMFAVFLDDLPIGIGALKPFDNYVELKRMYVRPGFQGRGAAKLILNALEKEAISMGFTISRLETGVFQKAAISFYKKAGYKDCEPFGLYSKNDYNIYFEKNLSETEDSDS